MEYQEFVKRTQQAGELMQSTRLQETVDFLYLFFLSDISDVDKAGVCANLAKVYDRLGNTDTAITWYDKGIELEQNYSRFAVAEKKAQYLSQIGRSKDAVPIYESLIRQPYVCEEDKERMRKITQTLLGQAMRQMH